LFRLLHLVPKNWLSHAFGNLVRSRLPFGLHRGIRDWFIRSYKVDCSDAEKPVDQYETLGDFFIRRLKPGARPLADSPIISPVDGTLTQMGRFQGGQARLTQIKGLDYSLDELAGPGWDLSSYRDGGGFLTIYLAPYNYHRIHAPIAGRITQVGYVPGALWPVNTWSVNNIPGLFVVNERIAVEFESPEGKVLLVMVGATNVGRITLDFHPGIAGNRRPPSPKGIWRPPQALDVGKGQGVGCFELGSTVILALSRSWMERLQPTLSSAIPSVVRMGQGLAS
jgi:phosphatidylserine decarboxylase